MLACPNTSTRGRIRVLILGPLNSPHVEHHALGARERGFEVFVAGDVSTAMPKTTLPQNGFDVSVASSPTARWLRNLLSRVRPDVVHAHWLPSAFRYLMYGAVPMVATAWGSDVYRAGWAGRFQNRVVARYAGLVMADSLDLLERLTEMGADPKRTVLLNWGVDLSTFSPSSVSRSTLRQKLGLPEGRMILSPRSLTDLYNPRTIIDAFEVVAESHTDVHLVLKHLQPGAPALGPLRYPERVRAVGYVPYEEMADYYRAADVCVSIPSSDSSPRSVWEAMACGAPCVLSDLAWVDDLLRHERDALVVPIHCAAVAAAIERLLVEAELVSHLAANARVIVEENRNREVELDRLAAVYERLARERPGTSYRARFLQAVAVKMGTTMSYARRGLRGIPVVV
jgi:glycosyltransferase involved in cell wall biosynthesis